MTVKDIKDKFGKLDGSLSKIENILNNASTGVDFYNAYNAYQNAENGSPEQGLAIIDIFNSMFTLVQIRYHLSWVVHIWMLEVGLWK